MCLNEGGMDIRAAQDEAGADDWCGYPPDTDGIAEGADNMAGKAEENRIWALEFVNWWLLPDKSGSFWTTL